MNRLASFVLDLLFPARCPWCGAVAGKAPHDCEMLRQAEALRLPARPLPEPEGLAEDWRLKAAWACFAYEEPVRGAILRMKFEAERNLAVPMGQQLALRCEDCGISEAADVLVPVPVSTATRRARGYNQSALVAWELARRTALPCRPGALEKVRETAPQRELSRAGRLTNVAGAYRAQPAELEGRRVLLVDDIFTTGSTLNECAKTLLAAGAAECRALCIAAARAEKAD